MMTKIKILIIAAIIALMTTSCNSIIVPDSIIEYKDPKTGLKVKYAGKKISVDVTDAVNEKLGNVQGLTITPIKEEAKVSTAPPSRVLAEK